MALKKGNKKTKNLLLIMVLLFTLCLCFGAFTRTINGKKDNTETSQITPAPTDEFRPTETESFDIVVPEVPADTSSNSSKSQYVNIFGKIWTGVEVYFGNPPEVIFTILGGNDSCKAVPSQRGLYVEYPDGTREWKDREYIITSGLFKVYKDDPAIPKLEWHIYPCE